MALFGVLLIVVLVGVNGESNADLVNSKVERTIDLTTNVVHITNVITVENTAKSGSLKSYTFLVEPVNVPYVASVGAHVSTTKLKLLNVFNL